MYLEFDSLTPSERYFAMVQSIVPRPIAWVLSDNGNGSHNLAPFSFFTGICSDPPLLMLSIGKKPSGDEGGMPKDTRKNIQQRAKFVVHIANTDSLQALNDTAATLNHGDSEIERAKLKTTPFNGFDLPRLSDCEIAFACELYRIDEVGNAPQAVIYGEIKAMYVSDQVLNKDNPSRFVIDPLRLNPLARLGGSLYSSLGNILGANRPK